MAKQKPIILSKWQAFLDHHWTGKNLALDPITRLNQAKTLLKNVLTPTPSLKRWGSVMAMYFPATPSFQYRKELNEIQESLIREIKETDQQEGGLKLDWGRIYFQTSFSRLLRQAAQKPFSHINPFENGFRFDLIDRGLQRIFHGIQAVSAEGAHVRHPAREKIMPTTAFELNMLPHYQEFQVSNNLALDTRFVFFHELGHILLFTKPQSYPMTPLNAWYHECFSDVFGLLQCAGSCPDEESFNQFKDQLIAVRKKFKETHATIFSLQSMDFGWERIKKLNPEEKMILADVWAQRGLNQRIQIVRGFYENQAQTFQTSKNKFLTPTWSAEKTKLKKREFFTLIEQGIKTLGGGLGLKAQNEIRQTIKNFLYYAAYQKTGCLFTSKKSSLLPPELWQEESKSWIQTFKRSMEEGKNPQKWSNSLILFLEGPALEWIHSQPFPLSTSLFEFLGRQVPSEERRRTHLFQPRVADYLADWIAFLHSQKLFKGGKPCLNWLEISPLYQKDPIRYQKILNKYNMDYNPAPGRARKSSHVSTPQSH